MYEARWKLITDPAYAPPLPVGTYAVSFLVCAAYCDNQHPYSGVYAQKSTTFYITAN